MLYEVITGAGARGSGRARPGESGRRAGSPSESIEVQRLHLARQRIAPPAEKLGGFLAVAVGLAHGDASYNFV